MRRDVATWRQLSLAVMCHSGPATGSPPVLCGAVSCHYPQQQGAPRLLPALTLPGFRVGEMQPAAQLLRPATQLLRLAASPAAPACYGWGVMPRHAWGGQAGGWAERI